MAHIRKRGNTYTYTVDIGIDPLTGKRNQITKGGFKRKRDAEASARKLEIEPDENRFIKGSSEIFSSFVNDWFTNHFQKRVKQTTAAAIQYIIQKHILRENPFAHKEISKITTADIDAFYNLKLKEKCSTSYIRKMHQVLNQAFQQAVRWKMISVNPVTEADTPLVRKAKISIWSKENIQAFLDKCKDERHYMTFLLAIYTGMRKGEILGLSWNNIDFEKSLIQVNQSLAYIPKQGYVITTPKTNNSIRYVPIPKFIIDELHVHRNKQKEWKELIADQYENSDLVICTHTGAKQDPRNVNRVMKRIIKSAHVPDIPFHGIRHTHASILFSEGVDIVRTSLRLGHSNPKTTLGIYAHLLPNSDHDVADIFHNAMQDNKDKE